MCVAVINSPNNAQAGPPPRPVCGCVSGGRDPDLISINCAGPAAVLGPHMFLLFLGCVCLSPSGFGAWKRPGARTHCEIKGDNKIIHTLSRCS